MSDGGMAMIGLGSSDTENRAIEAVERAINNPLLDVDVDGAKGALINICGGSSITIKECQEIVERVSSILDPNAKIIWGAVIDKSLGEGVNTLVIVTGVKTLDHFEEKEVIRQTKKKEIDNTLGVDVVD
jgi:cell division protein FtsZ